MVWILLLFMMYWWEEFQIQTLKSKLNQKCDWLQQFLVILGCQSKVAVGAILGFVFPHLMVHNLFLKYLPLSFSVH